MNIADGRCFGGLFSQAGIGAFQEFTESPFLYQPARPACEIGRSGRRTNGIQQTRLILPRAIAFQVRDVFDVMRSEAGTSLQTLLADGGASRNDLLMQIQADTLGCAVERSRSAEVSPLGAAFLAGLAVGIWSDEDEIAALMPPRDRFQPQMDEEERRDRHLAWQAAVRRTIDRQDT